MNDKSTLRKHFRAQRQALSSIEQQSAADAVLTQFIAQTDLSKQHHFAVYFAHDGELDPRPIIQWLWQQEKSVYLPILRAQSLCFAPYRADSVLVENQFGIAEPDDDTVLEAEDLEVILMPLVAFDSLGHRLGRGAGYYDRALAQSRHDKRPTLIGLAHDCQRADQLPSDDWDIPLDGILTPTTLVQPQN